MRKVPIGDVHVTDDECTNPYRYHGNYRTGGQRVLALTVFKHGGLTIGLQLWEAPASGGARRITADEVTWETSGIQ
ncbi:MAG: hypothetical protein ACRETG_02710 [Steroidobacteraceae bacterium]